MTKEDIFEDILEALETVEQQFRPGTPVRNQLEMAFRNMGGIAGTKRSIKVQLNPMVEENSTSFSVVNIISGGEKV